MTDPWNDCNAAARPFYTAIQVAVRWCGLLDHEHEIIDALSHGSRHLLEQKWPCLIQRLDRVSYAMRTGKLPHGVDGNPKFNDGRQRSESRWTVDHDDLKAWISKNYPGERPAFLFDDIERTTHTVINADSFRALQADLDAARAELRKSEKRANEYHAKYEALRTEHDALLGERDSLRSMVEVERVSIRSAPAQNPPGETVTLPHMNRALHLLFKIMWDNWHDFDPKRPPKQVNIAAEIDAAMKWNTERDGTPSRNAKALAAIIKPDPQE